MTRVLTPSLVLQGERKISRISLWLTSEVTIFIPALVCFPNQPH